MTQYTGTKTIKACPMLLGEAEKVLGRHIDTTAVENRETTEGYLVEYEDGYQSWSPKEVFEKSYRVSETHLDRMNIELQEVQERYLKGRKFSFSQDFRKLSERKRNALRKQLDSMENYLYLLSHRIEMEIVSNTESLPKQEETDTCKPNNA